MTIAGTEVVVAYAGLQSLCWLFLLPLSLYIARLKVIENWVTIHHNVNVGVVICVLSAILTVRIAHITENEGGHRRRLGGGHDGGSSSIPHTETGWALFALLGLQLGIGLFRPDQSSGKRAIWTLIHRGSSYVTILLAMYQIISEFLHDSTSSDIRILVLSIFIPVIAVCWILTYFFYLKSSPLVIDTELGKVSSTEEQVAMVTIIENSTDKGSKPDI